MTLRIAALAAAAALVAAPAFAQTATTTTKTAAAPTSSVKETKSMTKGPAGKTTKHKKVEHKADANGSKTVTTVENKTH